MIFTDIYIYTHTTNGLWVNWYQLPYVGRSFQRVPNIKPHVLLKMRARGLALSFALHMCTSLSSSPCRLFQKIYIYTLTNIIFNLKKSF